MNVILHANILNCKVTQEKNALKKKRKNITVLDRINFLLKKTTFRYISPNFLKQHNILHIYIVISYQNSYSVRYQNYNFF